MALETVRDGTSGEADGLPALLYAPGVGVPRLDGRVAAGHLTRASLVTRLAFSHTGARPPTLLRMTRISEA